MSGVSLKLSRAAKPHSASGVAKQPRAEARSKRLLAPVDGFTATSSLSQRLNAQWETKWTASAQTPELEGAVDALFERINGKHLLDERYEGMRVVSGLGSEGALETILVPGRNERPTTQLKVSGVEHSDLSLQSMTDERAIAWKDYVVRPNIYPYAPMSSNHLIIATATSQPQSFSPRRLSDLIDFQNVVGAHHPITLHYNGIASNSEFHWHWQATQETVPLERELDSGHLKLDVHARGEHGLVASYDHGFFAGLLVQGPPKYVVEQATEVVRRLDADPLTRGAYNMLLLKPKDGQTRLVVIPRRADDLKPRTEKFGAMALGATSLAGRLIRVAADVPDGWVEASEQAARETVVRPAELGWLDELGAASGAPSKLPSATDWQRLDSAA